MNKFPRRKLITTGLTVAAGASGIAVAANRYYNVVGYDDLDRDLLRMTLVRAKDVDPARLVVFLAMRPRDMDAPRAHPESNV